MAKRRRKGKSVRRSHGARTSATHKNRKVQLFSLSLSLFLCFTRVQSFFSYYFVSCQTCAHLFSWHFDHRPFYPVISFLFHLHTPRHTTYTTSLHTPPFICEAAKMRRSSRVAISNMHCECEIETGQENSKFNANDLLFKQHLRSQIQTHRVRYAHILCSLICLTISVFLLSSFFFFVHCFSVL